MPVTPDKKQNLRTAKEKIESLQDIDIVVLPEMFICPYDTTCFPKYAEKKDGDSVRCLSQIAKENHIYLVAGSIPEKENNLIYNTSFVFDRDGQVIATNRKVHLFDIDIKNGQYFKESDTLSAGNSASVFDTEFGKIGLCICYDIRFPEFIRSIADRGIKMLIVPAAFNMTTGPAHWELLFRSRAMDYQIFTAGCAPARNPEASYQSWGHTIICDPWGKVLVQADEKSAIITCDIDFAVIDKLHEQLPVLKQRRRDLY
jgi:predicted amidohydrolase